jgi:2-methylisocitrate lyase-like PEP mutase family enzyme
VIRFFGRMWPRSLAKARAYARQFEAMGVDKPPAEAIVEAVCLRGDPDRARERLEAYRNAGADLPVVYPVLAPWGEGREAALAVLGTFSS